MAYSIAKVILLKQGLWQIYPSDLQNVFDLIAKVILLKQGLWQECADYNDDCTLYCKGYSIKTRIVT